MDKELTSYNLKKIISGRRTEYFKYSCLIQSNKESHNKEGRRGKEEVPEEQKQAYREANKKQTLNNARNKITRLVSANEESWETFITLTYRDNMQDISKSKEHIKRYFKKLKDDYEELKYIYVIEFQKRGAIHYHMLTNIKFNIELSKKEKSMDHKVLEQNFSNKYWSNRGFVDIKDVKNDSDIRNVSKYISAYMVDDLFTVDLKGNKSHGYSRNLKKPQVKKMCNTKLGAEDLINKDGKTIYINSYSVMYKDRDGMARGGTCMYFDNLKED